jgi:hypothetical protein
MPRDRQTWRALVLSIGLFCLTVSNGCLRSSFVRSASTPAPDSASASSTGPAGGPSTVSDRAASPTGAIPTSTSPGPATAAQASAEQVLPSTSTPSQSPGPEAAAPYPLEATPVATELSRPVSGTRNVTESDAPSETAPPPSNATPMLDAAIRRVAAVTAQQREALASETTPDSAPRENPPPVSVRSPDDASPASKASMLPPASDSSPPFGSSERPQPVDQAPVPPIPISVLANPSLPSSEAAPISSPDPPAAQPPAPSPAPAETVAQTQPDQGEEKPGDPARDRSPADNARSNGPDQAAAPDDRTPLVISELRLCRNVMGFGSFEPLSGTVLKGGQRLLIYWELTGLQYETRGAEFVSRISSRIELRPAGGGPVRWEQELGAAEDTCRHRRQDYYVNYRVSLPKSLPSGSYHLRLVQTDLVAIRSTSAEIPIEIAE